MRDTTSDARLKTGTWVLLVIIAGLSGGFAGVVGATLGGAGESGRASAGEESLAAAVRQLATQMTALQRVLAEQPRVVPEARPSATTAPSPGAAADAAPAPLVARPDIETVLQSLVAALREEASAGRGAPTLVVPPPDPSRREKVFKLQDQDNSAITRAHLFWSEQALLDAYGPPDSVEIHDDGDRWYYKPGAPGRYVSFLVHNGRVFQSWSQ